MTKQTYKKWSMADHAELVLMREARVATKEIARALKRTPSSVVNHIYQHEIPYGRTETFNEVIDAALARGEIEISNNDNILFKPDINNKNRANKWIARERASRKQRRKNTFMMVITAFIVFVGLVSIYLQIT